MTDGEFFRRAWLTLKATATSKQRKQMDEIEFGLEGIRVRKVPKTEERKDERDKIIPL